MDSDLKSELTCPVCMELFFRPLRLGCGHSYCRNCLLAMAKQSIPSTAEPNRHPGSISCPECRRVFDIPSTGVDSFQVDFKLSKLVEVFKKMETDEQEFVQRTQDSNMKPGDPDVPNPVSSSRQDENSVATNETENAGFMSHSTVPSSTPADQHTTNGSVDAATGDPVHAGQCLAPFTSAANAVTVTREANCSRASRLTRERIRDFDSSDSSDSGGQATGSGRRRRRNKVLQFFSSLLSLTSSDDDMCETASSSSSNSNLYRLPETRQVSVPTRECCSHTTQGGGDGVTANEHRLTADANRSTVDPTRSEDRASSERDLVTGSAVRTTDGGDMATATAYPSTCDRVGNTVIAVASKTSHRGGAAVCADREPSVEGKPFAGEAATADGTRNTDHRIKTPTGSALSCESNVTSILSSRDVQAALGTETYADIPNVNQQEMTSSSKLETFQRREKKVVRTKKKKKRSLFSFFDSSSSSVSEEEDEDRFSSDDDLLTDHTGNRLHTAPRHDDDTLLH